jgi:hypothetical protein
VHAVAPEPLLSYDLQELLKEEAARRLRVPLPRLALRRRVGYLADVVYNRQHILPQRLLEAGFEFERPNPLDGVHALLAAHAEAEAAARAATKRGSLLAGLLRKAGQTRRARVRASVSEDGPA